MPCREDFKVQEHEDDYYQAGALEDMMMMMTMMMMMMMMVMMVMVMVMVVMMMMMMMVMMMMVMVMVMVVVLIVMITMAMKKMLYKNIRIHWQLQRFGSSEEVAKVLFVPYQIHEKAKVQSFKPPSLPEQQHT